MKSIIPCLLTLILTASLHADPLRVCATVPDLGSITQSIGGDEVTVIVFAKGGEDVHFVEARPSFVKELSTADLYMQMGLELEIGWAPVLLKNARNERVLPGAPGYLDCSTAISPIDVPTTTVDRSLGDVHPFGNPHYLLDPINGLKVARLIRDRLDKLRPESKATFDRNYQAFHDKLAAAMVGDKLAAQYDIEKLMLLADHDKLVPFLESQHQAELLGGWLGAMRPYKGALAVADHNMWRYFALRFGLDLVGYMEPKPGMAPTTSHTAELVDLMRRRNVKLIISSPYFDPRHAAFLAAHTDAKVAALAHQVHATDGTDDYLSFFQHDIDALMAALKQ
ncbi:MAG: hypothetical protein GC162_12455 [Planctomycetes bacterium]|nr:hypothetical protein [Planctomycetota bacterium]